VGSIAGRRRCSHRILTSALCRLLFWKRMSSSDNLVLRSLIYFVSSRALAVSSTYGVTTAMSVSVIKDAVWDSYVLYVFIYVFPLYCDIVFVISL